MFSLPRQLGSEEPAPTVQVTEDSRTLENLLCLCYPTHRPSLDALDDIVLVLEAAMKYEMEWMVPLLMRDLKVAVSQNPVKAWAMACCTGIRSEDVAREAASEILARVTLRSNRDKHPPSAGQSAFSLTLLGAIIREQGDEILHGVSAGDYFRLRQFIVSKSSDASFRMLTPPQEFASSPTFNSPSPDDSILRIGPPDIVLQCSADGMPCEAHSFVLGFHSPVLRSTIEAELAAIPRQPYDLSLNIIDRRQQIHHTPPVISLDIRSDTLAVLLGLCYGTMPPPSHLPLLASAIIASKKYEMTQVEKLLAERWDELAELSPLEAYFVAVQHRMVTCAKAAAKFVLRHPITDTYVNAMESLTALAYRRILDYYGSCADSVRGHFKKVIGKWNAPDPRSYPGIQHTEVVADCLSSFVERIDSEGHGPSTVLRDSDLPSLFRRFCSSNLSAGDILWNWRGREYCS